MEEIINLDTSTKIIFYIIGVLITYLFLFFFGKKLLKIDFDNMERTYANYDNWNSNQEAYCWWSFGWPAILVVSIIYLPSFIGLILKKYLPVK